MNDIAAAGGGKAEIKKGIKNCANIKKEKKIRYGLKKTICMMVKTWREREEIVKENVKSETVQKIQTYQCFGITINQKGNLE